MAVCGRTPWGLSSFRRCAYCSSWTNKLITAKDHASVQINIGHLNENGQYDGTFTTIALAGKVRAMVSAPDRALGIVDGHAVGLLPYHGDRRMAWRWLKLRALMHAGHRRLSSGHTVEEAGGGHWPATLVIADWVESSVHGPNTMCTWCSHVSFCLM